jgi:hypothetical protein
MIGEALGYAIGARNDPATTETCDTRIELCLKRGRDCSHCVFFILQLKLKAIKLERLTFGHLNVMAGA